MPVRQAIPAVIAANRWLDQAGTVAISTASERQEHMAGMIAEGRRRRRRIAFATNPPPNRFAHELTQFGFVHRFTPARPPNR